MKIVFAGSPEFAVPTLDRLAAEEFEVLAVLTQPDRPAGREQQLHPSPVKQAAMRLGLPFYQPERIKGDEARAYLEVLRPEVVVVVGYGQILPPWLLELPRYGCINLHASLLPAYRGAAPIQWAIANGETKTGLTTMLMDPGLDTGPILLQWETEIGPEETAIQLAERLSVKGADLMVETLRGLEAGTLIPRAQDNARASRAPLLKKDDGLIDWNRPSQEIFNRLRGFLPWPGAYSSFRGKKLQIWSAKPRDLAPNSGAVPGALFVEEGGLVARCGENTALEILEVQLEGRRRMSAADFLHGFHPASGDRLGQQKC